ncbi:MAG TPA: LiaF domain-containing protein [Symbiobacteriaceae bacterium]|nr:LiaF domain-containing protein [Symbiobacteriaceae bacterium]
MERRIVGFGLIAAGLIFLLDRMSLVMMDFSIWSIAWVLLGGYLVQKAVRWGRVRWIQLGFGGWLMAVGLMDILFGMGLSPIGGALIRGAFWPVILLMLGITILTGGIKIGFISDGEWSHHTRRWGAVGDSRLGGPGYVIQEDMQISHGIGETRVDLSQAEVLPGTWNLQVEQGIGDSTIYLPGNVSVIVEANVGLGDLEVLGERRSGITPSLKRQLIMPEADATLIVKAQNGLGRLRILQAAPFGDPRRDGRIVRPIVDLEMEG